MLRSDTEAHAQCLGHSRLSKSSPCQPQTITRCPPSKESLIDGATLVSCIPSSLHLVMTGPAPRGTLVEASRFLKSAFESMQRKAEADPAAGEGCAEKAGTSHLLSLWFLLVSQALTLAGQWPWHHLRHLGVLEEGAGSGRQGLWAPTASLLMLPSSCQLLCSADCVRLRPEPSRGH